MEPVENEAVQSPERGYHTSSSNVANLSAIKRAPSDTTVNDSLYGKSAWERSQSEANLDSIDGAVARAATRSSVKAYKTKVSEHSQVYWDLPRAVEQGNAGQSQQQQQQQQTPNSPGNRVVLETIHQREELKHFSSSSESLTRFYGGQDINNHSEDNAGNYFCDSDFDDSREQRPNYLLRLERMQAELLKQMHIYKELARQRESATDHVFEESLKAKQRLASGEALDEEVEDTAGGMEDVGKLLESATVESQSQALDACHQLLVTAWETPQSGRDCATSMCSLIRREGLLTMLTANLASDATPPSLRLASARLVSQALTNDNVSALMGMAIEEEEKKEETKEEEKEDEGKGGGGGDGGGGGGSCRMKVQFGASRFVERMIRRMWHHRTDVELNCEMLACLEAMFKHSEETCRRVIHFGGLRSVIYSCRSVHKSTLRHAAIALANLSLYGGTENQAEMIRQRVADWLFPLAFSIDDVIHYYACLAIVVLSTNRELSQAVEESGTLNLVLPFIQQHTPREFAACEPSHLQGRSKGWLERLVPALRSEREEVQALAAFHFAMEAIIKKQQGKTELFKEIGAIVALRHVASCPNAIASKLAAQALASIGEAVPHTLSPQVPLWSQEDVQFWLEQVKLADLVPAFAASKVDGDLLLLLTDGSLRDDVGVANGLLRRRILRELRRLRMGASYHAVDPSQLDRWLRQHVGRDFGQYSYGLLAAGVDRQFLPHVTEEQLRNDCAIENGIHRAKILLSIDAHCPQQPVCPACKRKRHSNSESIALELPTSDPGSATQLNFTTTAAVAPLGCSGHAAETADVFISYRRSTGSQLASLLKVHLQLRGYRVFLDIERLAAGPFDESLLSSVRSSRNFVFVCTTGTLDRCLGDDERKDWVHKEVVTALESNVNIIPVTDRFEWPSTEQLPADMRAVAKYNGINWIHEYQEACIDRLEKFLVSREVSPFSTPCVLLNPSWRKLTSDYGRTPLLAPMTPSARAPTITEPPTPATDPNAKSKSM